MNPTIFRITSISALALAPLITGCATKKYVRATVAPIEQRVGGLDETTKNQGKQIEDLERGVARADERAMGADTRAEAAARQAELARKEAGEGIALANQGLTRADQLGKDMNSMNSSIQARLEAMKNLKPIVNEQVLFASGQSELNAAGKAILDKAVAQAGKFKNFVVEIQGFTDSTGSKQQNLELSRKRADAVVRYLTVTHNMPLHQIFVAGLGEEKQVADNKTRDGRQQNRRVEVKVYAPADQLPNQVSTLNQPAIN